MGSGLVLEDWIVGSFTSVHGHQLLCLAPQLCVAFPVAVETCREDVICLNTLPTP